MLKLEKSQYIRVNYIFYSNYTRYEKTLSYKIVYYKMICKFESLHFFRRCIFLFFILKNTIENPKFNFLTIICGIRKKRLDGKLFA